jgi:hypothetical protein
VVALARNLYFVGSRILAGLTAVLITTLYQAPAWQVRALILPISHHDFFSFLEFVSKYRCRLAAARSDSPSSSKGIGHIRGESRYLLRPTRSESDPRLTDINLEQGV